MLFIILSILLFSFNNVLWKKNLETTNVIFLVSYRALFTSLISICILFFYIKNVTLDYDSFLKITAGSVLGVIGLFAMLIVVKKASLQWLGIYNLLGIIVTSVYLYVVENINISNSINGIIIILIGYGLFIFFNKQNENKLHFKYHFLLVIMTLSFSFSSIIQWRNLNQDIHPILITANQEVLVFIVSTLCLLFFNKKLINRKHYATHLKKTILMGLIIFFALLFSFIGIKATNPIIMGALFLASPLTTILFSYLFFKDKIMLKNIVSIVIIAIGAFILHYNN